MVSGSRLVRIMILASEMPVFGALSLRARIPSRLRLLPLPTSLRPYMQPVLLERVASGDPEAVQLCIDRYQGLVWTLARGFFADSAEVDDAVQDVFIDLWKNAGRFDSTRGKESTFVGLLARRRLIDRLRKKTRRPDSASIEMEPVSNEETVDIRLSRSEDARVAKEILDTLPPQQRQAIELAVLHGYTHQEVSQKLEIPLGTVKAHVRRGLQRLRDRLGVASPSMGGLA